MAQPISTPAAEEGAAMGHGRDTSTCQTLSSSMVSVSSGHMAPHRAEAEFPHTLSPHDDPASLGSNQEGAPHSPWKSHCLKKVVQTPLPSTSGQMSQKRTMLCTEIFHAAEFIETQEKNEIA